MRTSRSRACYFFIRQKDDRKQREEDKIKEEKKNTHK